MDFLMVQRGRIGGTINVNAKWTKRDTGDLSENHP